MGWLRAIATVLVWPCNWHYPGDDECFAWDERPTDAQVELVWKWANRLPRRLHGCLAP